MNLKKYLDTRIERIHCIISPEQMMAKIPACGEQYSFIFKARKTVSNILSGKDRRFLLIAGPCSVHDTEAAFEYAQKLSALQKKYARLFYFLIRSYFEKPRTSLGWRGLIVEPDLNGFINIGLGLERARFFLRRLTELNMPAAVEMLDPLVPQYLADLVSWASVGARTAESQVHRELASGLSMPVGFKNATDGDISAAVNGIISARFPHAFIGIAGNGLSAIIHTSGNPDSHLILRGSASSPNYDKASVLSAVKTAEKAGLNASILIDCSHGNSARNPEMQPDILMNTLALRFDKTEPLTCLRGCMLESFLKEGCCKIGEHSLLENYGKSVTDPCMSWEQTEKALKTAYKMFSSRV